MEEHKYDDIINLPHPDPKFHQRMSAIDRAGQFAPFAALTGYDAMVAETSRLTDSRQELDEEQMLSLNENLTAIIGNIGNHPAVSITWFRKDSRKKGGAYMVTEGRVRDVDLANRIIVLKNGDRISLDDIVSIVFLQQLFVLPL